MTAHVECIFLIAAAAIVQAIFVLPIPFFRNWQWEHMWTAQAITCGLCALVWAAFVPRAFWLMAAALPPTHWILCYCFGLLWGVGGVAYGLTITRLGISFAYSFVFGITVLVGALLPFLLDSTLRPARPGAFAEGLLLALAGMTVIGIARRGDQEDALMTLPFSPPRYHWAVCLAVAAGMFSACYGLAFSLRIRVLTSLISHGISPTLASVAVALPLYAGSASFAVPFGLACARRTKTLRSFFQSNLSWNWTLAIVMGICGVGGSVFYGWASTRAGHLSPSVSYCIFMILFIVAGNGVALATGELHRRSRAANAALVGSIACLIGAVWLLRQS